MDIKISECPFCHGTELVYAKQEGHAQLSSCHSSWQGAVLYHDICRRCGSVVRSYVKDAEKLLKIKDRREKAQ